MKMKKGTSLKNVTGNETRERRSPAEVAIELVERYRFILAAALVILLVTIIAGFAYQAIQQNRLDSMAELTEQLEESYFDWMQADENNRETAFDTFWEHYSVAQDSYGRMYAGTIANFLLAQLRYNEENYPEAADLFSSVSSRTESHLAPVAAMNGAAAYEQAGMREEASTMYRFVIDTFGTDSAESPRAMFSLGRLSESSNIQTALMWYERINDDFPRSEWNQLANNRIIVLRYAD